MGVQTAVDVLARILEAYETGDRPIRHVGATTTGPGADSLQVDLEVPVPLEADGDGGADRPPVDATLSDEGELLVQVPTEEIAAAPTPPEADVSMTPTAAQVSDGEVLLTLEVTIAPTDGAGRPTSEAEGRQTAPAPPDAGQDPAAHDRSDAGTHDDRDRAGTGPDGPPSDAGRDGGRAGSQDARSMADAGGDRDSSPPTNGSPEDAAVAEDGTPGPIEAARNEDVPPYDDTEYLRAIYDRFGTFSEMRQVIEMDVSTETVRRYMIDAGVHDPNSYETTGAASSPQGNGRDAPAETRSGQVPDEHLVTDGIGLPDDLSLEDVLDAVVESSTVYEVTRRLELDQRRTRELLEHLDLLDLVMHRVSDDRTREVSYEDVADRLRRVAAAT